MKLAARDNPDWYRVKYNLAAAYANQGATVSVLPDGSSEWRAARGHSSELAIAAGEAIQRLRQADGALRELLETTIEPAALILVAGTLPPVRRPRLDDMPTRFSRELVLETLRSGEPDTNLLVGFVLEREETLGPSVYYNLACLSARRKETATLAMEQLERAIGRTPIDGRAALQNAIAGDPALAPLRSWIPNFDDRVKQAART